MNTNKPALFIAGLVIFFASLWLGSYFLWMGFDKGIAAEWYDFPTFITSVLGCITGFACVKQSLGL